MEDKIKSASHLENPLILAAYDMFFAKSYSPISIAVNLISPNNFFSFLIMCLWQVVVFHWFWLIVIKNFWIESWRFRYDDKIQNQRR